MMKKLLFVIDSLGCGGAEKSLVSLLPLLNRDKYEIHLWMLHRGGEFESLLPEHIIIEPEPLYGLLERIKMRMASLCYSLTYRIKRLLGIHEHGAETLWKCMGWAFKVPEENYDVAIAYQQGLPTYLVAKKIRAHKRIAWINADIFSVGYNPVFNARFYTRFDVIVPVSKKLEEILETHYCQFSNKFLCAYDILNPDIIKKQASEVLDEQFSRGNTITIVTTGRLALPKNYILAVKAAKILRDKGADFKWFFIGEGSERSRIDNLIKEYNLSDQVILLGMCSNPYPYMARCNVYVQTSSFEGFGLTIAEAKILGRPVVSTNFDVVHDQITHGENGLIAEMTPESVADNIICLLSDKEIRDHIIANVHKEKNTTYVTEVKKVESLLDAN